MPPPALDSFPTILVVGNNDRVSILARSLQQDGYSVLEASDLDEAVRVVRTHSRQIHLVLVQDSVNAPNLVELLEPFRLGAIPVLYVGGSPNASLPDVREHCSLPTPPQPLKQKGQAA